MDWWIILLIVLGSLLVLALLGYLSFVFGISNMMANKICTPKHYKTKTDKDEELAKLGKIDGVDQYQRTPIEFVMKDGYILHGDYSLNNPKKFVICMHGHSSNREGQLKYAYAFYRLGYSIIFYDHRSHGENERQYVTMGYREHLDALEVFKQVREKFGQDIELGLFGCSMGGATALMCLKEEQNLSFVVSDCAPSSLKEMVREICIVHKSPPGIFLIITNLLLKMKFHFSYKNSCAVDAVKENKNVPVLFIHGDKDGFVFPLNAEILYNACASKKRLEMFENAEHCGSVVVDKERYYKVIEEFIKDK